MLNETTVVSSSLIKYVFTFFSIILAVIWASGPKKKNKYSARPKVTLKCRFLNFMLWPYQRFQLRKEFLPMELPKIKKFAMKKTGLEDFGGSLHETSFAYIIQLANKTCYSPVGYAAIQDFMKRLLITRLRFVEELKQVKMKEFCTANPIRQPIFIVGLPRTGTTFLHRLLSLDPSNTAPLTWELMDPVPRIKDDLVKDMKKRIKYCQVNIDMLLSLIPHFAEAHELGAVAPEECTVLMGIDAPALVFNFHTLLNEQEVFYTWNWTEAYQNYYKGLQIIQSYRGLRRGNPDTRRWVLKAPPHLGVLDHLTNAFPDARIIWNHRDPKECLPSLASLIRAGQDVCEGSGTIQLDELGQHMVTYAENMYKRGDTFYDTVGETSSCCCSHVLYKNLISDPIGTVRALYKDFGYEFTDEYKSKIEAYLEDDKKKRDAMKGNKGKLHKYTLEEYGLTDAEIDNKFSWYYEKYISANK